MNKDQTYNQQPMQVVTFPLADVGTNATAGCQHWWRFLDYLGVRKDEGTFYCQKCLHVKSSILKS